MPTNAELKDEIIKVATEKGLEVPEIPDDMSNAERAARLKSLREAQPQAPKPPAAPEPEGELVKYAVGEGKSITRGGKIYGPGEAIDPNWFTEDELKTHVAKDRIVEA